MDKTMRIIYVSQKFNEVGAALKGCPDDEFVIIVDVDRCIACGSCSLACQAEHASFGKSIPTRHIVPRSHANRTGPPERILNLPGSCRQCTSPCQYNNGYNFWTFCPGEKSATRDQENIRCDACAERREAGLAPACVTRCSMKCLYAGCAKDMRFALEEKRLRGMGEKEFA